MPGGATRRFACWASAWGPGLRQSEIVAAQGSDVVVSPPTVSVHVGGARERLVAVNDHEAGLVSALTTISGGGYLFHPEQADRSSPNFVNDFCLNLVADPEAVCVALRASYVCDHLVTGTPLLGILAHAGIEEVESLLHYSGQVKGPALQVGAAPLHRARGHERPQSRARGSLSPTSRRFVPG